MPLNLDSARKRLQAFDLKKLFVEELGWSNYAAPARQIEHDGLSFTLSPVAELSGVAVFEVAAPDGVIPDASIRRALHRRVLKEHREHLLIFVNAQRNASDWYWVKREGAREYPRDHFYFKGQTGDLILSKLHDMVLIWATSTPTAASPLSRSRAA